MAVKLSFVFCVLVLATATTFALESWDAAGVRIAIRVYEECSNSDGFSPCLKQKALTFFNRLSRMDKLALSDDLLIIKSDDAAVNDSASTDEQLQNALPKDVDARDSALDTLLYNKVSSFIGSRTLRFTMPKVSLNDLGLQEGRGKKMKGMFGGMMMGIAGKMAAMIPVAIAGLYLLAGGGGGGGGWNGGGHGGGGWQSSGGGWDKRSLDDAQQLAYKAYVPQQ
ncbi:hypothetical protein MML48_5g00002978 [Holotrichia oblita]|uniref:Uncharacterized protein n=1 Tax=Holotrichia oblita TaxID=644536 RepID=A0ACB9T4G9_HOLOL|nr:hypothetical protein MML48_5g00002978 [Holotrichia oblita]